MLVRPAWLRFARFVKLKTPFFPSVFIIQGTFDQDKRSV